MPSGLYTEGTCAEDTATQGCDRSADSGPEWQAASVACRVNVIRVAYFPDLAPYAYGHRVHPGVVHVGWLDGVHPFPEGAVDRHLIEKMKSLAAKPVELYRGFHICE